MKIFGACREKLLRLEDEFVLDFEFDYTKDGIISILFKTVTDSFEA